MAFPSLLNPFRRRRAREAELAELAGRLAVTRSPLGDALWRLRRNRTALVAAAVLSLLKPDGVEGKSCAERA